MLATFLTITPFFGLILCGYLATRARFMPTPAIPGMNAFVLFFALPCMLFEFGRTLDASQIFDPVALAVYVSSAMVMVALGLWATLGRSYANHGKVHTVDTGQGLAPAYRVGWLDGAFGALVAAFPNSGFVGIPLLVALLGAQAAAPTILSILIDMVLTTSVCVALSQMDSAGVSGARAAAKKALRGVLFNPMPWALLLGMASRALELELLRPAQQMVGWLAASASPVALFTIGAVLARSDLMKAALGESPSSVRSGGSGSNSQINSQLSTLTHAASGLNTPTAHPLTAIHIPKPPSPVVPPSAPLASYASLVGFKLLLHPFLVLCMTAVLAQLGFKLERPTLVALLLVSALPSASNVSLLAERMGADNGRIARIILLTTALGFFSFSGLAALLV